MFDGFGLSPKLHAGGGGGRILRAGVHPSPTARAAVERMRAMQEHNMSPLARLMYDEFRAAILIAGSKIDYSQLTAIRMSLRQRLQDAVGRTMGQSTIIRDLAAYDVSGAASAAAGYARLSNVNALVANTWFAKDLSRQVPNNTAIGIYGYIQLQAIPQIDAIAFVLGSGVPLAQFWLDDIYADQTASIGFFDPPVVFSPLQTIQVNLLANAAVGAAGEIYGLKGFVAEPVGQTVAADQTNLV